MRCRLFKCIISQDIAFFDGMRTGDLTQRPTLTLTPTPTLPLTTDPKPNPDPDPSPDHWPYP